MSMLHNAVLSRFEDDSAPEIPYASVKRSLVQLGSMWRCFEKDLESAIGLGCIFDEINDLKYP